jgi:primary-amine oxidase
LDESEILAASDVLRQHNRVTERMRVAMITLQEPPKADVLADADRLNERHAFAVVYDLDRGCVIEVVISVTTGELIEERVLPDMQPPILQEEWELVERDVKAHPEWQAAVRKRGITDFDSIQVDPWPAGKFGLRVEEGRRLMRAVSYVRAKGASNAYGRPIEGVMAFWDRDTRAVSLVEDYGVVPIPDVDGEFGADRIDSRRDLKPLEITQPEGPSFRVDGHHVEWQKWSFRVSMHPVEGLVLHNVHYYDDSRSRSILYRGGLAEMVVPYGEMSPMHWWKNAFDAGEVGFGKMTNSLTRGCDCLGEIYYFDAIFADESGAPRRVKNVICMHEEDYGILWKHSDFGHRSDLPRGGVEVDGVSRTVSSEVRRSRRLVVSSFATVGSYDYGIYWYFYQDGTIQVEVKLTGIVQTKAIAAGDDPGNAVLVAPHLTAPNHQHFFCFRLDIDLDGTDNVVSEVEAARLPEADNPNGNAFGPRTTVLHRESEAQRVVDPLVGRYWKISNPALLNGLGQAVSYRLMPGAPSGMSTLLASSNSTIWKRANFATKNLWVTRFDDTERHPAGDYPYEHPGGAGLPAWIQRDAELENTDVVLWYTLGSTHISRPEDWPIMPVEYIGFMLRPDGFFEENPSLDVPPSIPHRASNGHDGASCH